MKKLSFLMVILAILSALVLVSCGGEETPSESSGSGTGNIPGSDEIAKVTITFDTDGGDSLASQIINKGDTITLPTPIKKGYSFDGWYVGDVKWDSTTVDADTTLTAKWTILEFEINYIVENGENNEINVSVYTVEDGFVLGEPTVIGKYYEFFGWILVLEDEEKPIEKIEKGTVGTLTLKANIKYQPFELALKDDNTYEVVGLRDPYMTEGEIPAYFNGKAVTSIKEQAFYGNTNMVKIALPDTLKTIGYEAFADCASLTSVRMSAGIEDIGTMAFLGCSALEYNVYENISYLGNESNPYIALMMTNDPTATACVIHESTRLISSQAFAVNALTSVTIPQSVKYLCFAAFGDCYSLASVTFEGEGLLSIGDYAFTTCASLLGINLPNGVQTIGDGAFMFTGLGTLVLPNTVTYLGKEAFMGCGSLKSITLSDSLEMMGENVFNGINKNVSLTKKNAVGYLGSPSNPYMMAYSKVNATTTEAPTPFVIEEGTKFIHSRAFTNCDVRELVLPNSVVFIGEQAYADCGNLTSVVLGTGVLHIGSSAFKNCDDLHYFTIQSAVNSMGGWIFQNSPYLYEINLGDKIETIGAQMLMGSIYIESITIPDSVKTIGQGAFLSCTALKKVVIGNGVTAIPQDAFQNCSQLSEVVMGKNVETIGIAAFSACTSLEVIDLGAKIVRIEEDAFISCSALKTVKIGDQIVYIDQYFNRYTSTIEFNRYDNAVYLGNDEKPYLVLIKVDEGATSCQIHEDTKIIYYSAFENSQIESISIPASVRYIYDNAFSGCSALASITFEDGCISFGKNAFKGAIISSITLPNTLEYIGEGAFTECQSLTSIKLPDSVTEMGKSVFANCRALTSATLSQSLTSIPEQAFQYCTKLNNVVVPSSVSEIGGFAFDSCSALAKITINEGVKSIGNGVFYSCNKLVSITMPNTLQSIGENVFYYCEKLESVELGSGVSTIGKRAFSRCSNLTFLTGGESVAVIGDYAFEYTDLMAINFTDSLKSIGISAFENCDKLTVAKLGNSLESIGERAFFKTSIKKITLPATLVTVGGYVFDSNSAIETINICAQEIPSTWNVNWCSKKDCTINLGYTE